MDLVGFLVTILVLVLVAGIVYWIISILPIPSPFREIALAILGVILIIILLSEVGLISGGSHFFARRP